MDILSPKGMETLQQEREAVDMFCRLFPQFSCVLTRKDTFCSIDAVFVRDSVIEACVETKCRKMTYAEFVGRFKSSWLITEDKLIRAGKMADLLCVPLVGLLFLVPEKVLLYKKLWQAGSYCVPVEVRETWTQKTVNGGLAVRKNAFVDMSQAKVIRSAD